MTDEIVLNADGRTQVLSLSARDYKVLSSEQLPEGKEFCEELVYHPDGRDVWITRDRVNLLRATAALLGALDRDADLLAYDYEFRMPPGNSWTGRGQSGFRIRGCYGSISRGPGKLLIALLPPNGSGGKREIIDLRRGGEIVTEEGLRIETRRKKRPFTLQEQATGLLKFLRSAEGAAIKSALREHKEEEA